MKWISWCVLLILSQNIFAQNGLLDGFDAGVINKKSYQLEFELRSWASTSTLDSDGLEEEFAEDEGYSQMEGDLLFRYGFGEQLELRGGGLFRQAKSTNMETTKSGGESIRLGAKYAFKRIGRWHYAVDLEYRATLYENIDYNSASEIPAGDIVLGDAGNYYHVKGILSYSAQNGNSFNGSLAYVGMPNN
jgi:hypothetical protein